MPTIAFAKPSNIKSYPSLRNAVKKRIQEGRERAMEAVKRERVRTAWESGKLIQEHILLNQSRANYGDKVMVRLERDLAISRSELGRMVEFSREFSIRATSRELSWGHYQALLGVNDVKKRDALAKRADKEDWPIKRLRSELRSLRRVNGRGIKKRLSLEPVSPGALDVYRTRLVNGRTLIDLGFSTYLEKRDVKKKLKRVEDRNFTYRAEVERVVDADTVWCVVDLGLGVKTRQKLRLRGIDAPELSSKAGQRAKRYLTRKLPRHTQIILSTSKADKFDRYLADIWIEKKYKLARSVKASAGSDWLTKAKYLNQKLVRQGHARIV